MSGTLINSVRIEYLDNFLEIYQFKLLFTIFCLLIIINGTNFIDGINTLVVVYYIMVITCILYLKYQFNFDYETEVLKITLLALVIFLFYNFLGKVYLGDNGSYLLSFLIGITLINISNNNDFISPYFVACLLWYPAYENLFSIIRKQLKKISPSQPDNKHLHQLIFIRLKKKLKFNQILLNTFTGLVINIYNLVVFVISVNNFSNTKILLLILITNMLIYTFLYSILKKGA